ncbi:MAG: MFS transporter [Rhodospirillaceae bacterium]|nr:MFS transporter [Rhodospirillaceae bacterium]
MSPDMSPRRGPLIRWFISSSTFGVPQAAGPIAFSLVALNLTGQTSGGAAMMLAMTLAQVGGAIPIARLGGSLPIATFLRVLVVIRTLALASIALLAAYEASFTWLIVLAAVAGSVNGAAHGYLRAVLNHLAPASRLPRTLGIAATLNELTFVLAPVAASGLGTVSPVFAVLVLAVIGAVPALLIPNTGSAHIAAVRGLGGSLLSPSILLWLMCAAGGGAAVAAIEIGALALALNFGYEPALAILFTVPLCLTSVAGGIWISVRNRMATRKTVLAQLFIMTLGSALAALNLSVATTVIATVLIGSVLAPLSTYYSLRLDTLAPPQRRAEVFALLRTANAMGVIFTSAALTVVSLSVALIVVTGLMIVVTLVVGIASVRQPPPLGDARP